MCARVRVWPWGEWTPEKKFDATGTHPPAHSLTHYSFLHTRFQKKQPKDHHTVKAEAFKPVERELIFDIDMTDYDDVRTCCEGAKICPKCWAFMNMAVKVVDTGLRGEGGRKGGVLGGWGVYGWVSVGDDGGDWWKGREGKGQRQRR
jgi:hypothetical protein